MPHSFRDTFIMFSLISLFSFAALSFVIQLQIENDGPNSLLENDLINRTFIDLGGDISQNEQTVNTSKGAFDSENPAPGFGSLIIFAIVGVTKTFTGVITGTYNILILLPITTLGVPTQIANVLGAILMMSLVFMAWRVYRVGS